MQEPKMMQFQMDSSGEGLCSLTWTCVNVETEQRITVKAILVTVKTCTLIHLILLLSCSEFQKQLSICKMCFKTPDLLYNLTITLISVCTDE